MHTKTPPDPAEPGGIPKILRMMAADFGMAREDLLAAATDMLAAAVDPAPMPKRKPDSSGRLPGREQILTRLKATGEAEAPATPTTPEARPLKDLHDRPASARFTPKEAALYLNISEQRLRTWRWKQKGPPYEGRSRFIRYTKGALDDFMRTEPEAT
jgi:hypothetical protein